MNKLIASLVIYTILVGSSYYGSTTAVVTLSGAIIKAKSVENTKKYKRKDCPVCKGKGWYISGDKIQKVDCGYCEPDEGASKSECADGQCTTRESKR